MSIERGRGRPPHNDVLTPAELRVTVASLTIKGTVVPSWKEKTAAMLPARAAN